MTFRAALVASLFLLGGCEKTTELVFSQSSAQRAAATQIGVDVGDRLPDFAFSTENGEKSSISDFRGKVTLVSFWASWCPPCRDELPSLNTLFVRVGHRSGVAFVLLQHSESVDVSRAFLADEGYSLPAMDSGHARGGGWRRRMMTRNSGLVDYSWLPKGTLPSSYLLDRNGVIVYRSRSKYNWYDMENPIRRLLEAKAR